MKTKLLAIIAATTLVLAACGSTDEGQSSNHGSVDDGETLSNTGAVTGGDSKESPLAGENKDELDADKGIGFGLTGGVIEEATNVPAEERDRILNVFDTYIDSFNEGNIDEYIDVLADETESFDKEEERSYLEETFEQFEVTRQAADVTIVEYDELEAQVFSRMETTRKLSSGLETTQTGRQVTVFKLEDEAWKVASIHYLGDTEEEKES